MSQEELGVAAVSPKISSRDDFQKVMEKLIEEVVVGKTHLMIGRGLADVVHTDEVIARVSPVFWGFTIWAHLDVAQLIAFKLFDKRKGTMTVEYLLGLASQHAGSFQKATPAEVKKITDNCRSKIDELRPALKPLETKRNRILAHRDPTIATDRQKLIAQTEVKIADLERAFETASEILDRVSVAFSNTSHAYDLLEGDDYDYAIQMIADAKHHQADKFEEEHGGTAPFPRPKRPQSRFF